jgi:hypothetical protein
VTRVLFAPPIPFPSILALRLGWMGAGDRIIAKAEYESIDQQMR